MPRFLRLSEKKNPSADYNRAKELRRLPTSGEEILWYQLRRASQGKKFKFRRQHPLHPYIVDFACLKLRLVIEVDGGSHESRFAKDKKRDEHLAQMGWEVMRFTNEQVLKERNNVVMAIINRANEKMEKADVDIPLP